MNVIRIFFALALSTLITSCTLHPCEEYGTWDLAELALRKGLQMEDFGTYQGCLLLQGMAEMAVTNPNSPVKQETEDIFLKFSTQEIVGKGSFISYQAGGNGAAYYNYIFKNQSPVLTQMVDSTADAMMKEQPRSKKGIMVPPWIEKKTFETMTMQPRNLDGSHILEGNLEGNDPVFVDMIFATTPFLLYVGLANDRQDYIDEAVYQTLSIFSELEDKSTGLLHQGKGFQGVNVLSEDNWSRGNAWGAIAIASLVRDLPANHPQREEVLALAKKFFDSILKYQNEEGLWNQEMTDPTSFVETSGSGIILYAMGIMIENGVLDKQYETNFKKGLQGLASYIGKDGSVSNACWSCLCIRQGLKEDYKNHAAVLNDSHAFGPIVLAYAQAYKMDIKQITPLHQLGIYVPNDTAITKPKVYVRYVPERKQDIAWENDKIAFRVFGYPVRSKVGSGIDIWPKRVAYPIIDRWYKFNQQGRDYHTDRGEGCDFYETGHLRGCGGLAIFTGDTVAISDTYINHRVLKNTEDEIIFTLIFSPWKVNDKFYGEHKTIRMKRGTNFFEVTSIIDALEDEEITVGLGLTNFGNAQVYQANSDKTAQLALWEKINPKYGALGVAVTAPQAYNQGVRQLGQDHYLTLKVKTNQPFTYKIGAAWEERGDFTSFDTWAKYIAKQADKAY